MADELARQETEARALRADLEALRRRLDQPPPPVTRRPRDRRPLLAAVVVGGSLAAAATIVLVPWVAPDGEGGTASRAATAAQAQALSDAVPAQFRAGPLGTRGPGIDEPGVLATVHVRPDGSLAVVEQAVLGPRGARELTLRLPDARNLSGPVAGLRPSIADLRVAVNDQPVQAVAATTGSGWSVRRADERARTVRVSYTLNDAASRTPGSRSGRAIGLLPPLLGGELHASGLPYRVSVTGGGVSGISCPGASAAGLLCGTENAGGWTARLPEGTGSPVVLMQLNL